MLFAEERQVKILDILDKKKKIVLPELCEFFKVSPSTIRNDLRELEGKGLLHRTHGGALVNSKVNLEPTPTEKEMYMIKQKKEIAEYAATFVDDGDIISICSGTTTYEFAKCLTKKRNLTIVVNDIRLALFLEEQTSFPIFITGGFIRNGFHFIKTAESEDLPLYTDRIFFSCNGLTLERGATIPDYSLAATEKKLINRSSKTYLLCDNSKIGNFFFSQIVPIKDITKIICDSETKTQNIENIQVKYPDKICIAPHITGEKD